jgi:hypothetical protein
MLRLPPPQTFAEGQRKLFGILAAVAGVAYGVAAIAGMWIIVWGAWPPELARLRLVILGIAMGGAVIGSIAVTLGLLVGGPVGRIDIEAGKDGAKLSAQDDAAATATARAEVTVKPADQP